MTQITACLLVLAGALAALAPSVNAQIGILFVDMSGTSAFKSHLINAIMGADLAMSGRFSTPKIIKYRHYTNGQEFAIYDAHNLQDDIDKMLSVYVDVLHMIVVIHPQVSDPEFTFGSDAYIHNVVGSDIKHEAKKFWRVFDQKLFGDFTERIAMCESEIVRQLVAGVRPEYPEITLERLRNEYTKCLDVDIANGRVLAEIGIIATVVVIVLKCICNPKQGYEHPAVMVPLAFSVVVVGLGMMLVGVPIVLRYTGNIIALQKCHISPGVVNQRHQDHMTINGTKVSGEWVDNKPDGVQTVTNITLNVCDDGSDQLALAGNMEIMMQGGIVMHNGVRLECVWK